MTTYTLPNAVIGAYYRYQLTPPTAHSGFWGRGDSPYNVSNTGLPYSFVGLTIDANGHIAGLPNATGTYSVYLIWWDQGNVAYQYAVTIVIGAADLATIQITLPAAQVGVPYDVTLPAQTGQHTGTQWGGLSATPQAPGLPFSFNGLTLETTGEIHGTPQNYGDQILHVTWFNSGFANPIDEIRTFNVRLPVVPATMVITGPATASGSLRDTPVWQPASTAGGYLPYQGITYAGLPPGLSWDGNQGYRLTGWPTQAGTFTCQCILIDAQGNQASCSFTLTIATPPPMVLTQNHPPTIGFRIPYSFALSCSSGTRGAANLLHYEVISGALPAGISLSYNGLLTGECRVSGTSTAQLRITDSDGWADTSNTLTLVVGPAPNIVLVSGNPVQGYEEIPYTFTLAASGGTGGGDGLYTYSAKPETLPPGVSITSVGVLTGTPTLAGYYSVTIFVTDSQGVQAALSIPITVLLAFTKRDPYRNVFYQVLNADGTPATDANGNLWTNDPNPSFGGKLTFAQVVVGYSIGTNQFTTTDVRVRGGGLVPEAQARPEADHFWDLGYLDGKPEPLGGALVIRLPSRLLATLSREFIQAKLQEILPLGTLPVLRFYDEQTGDESR